MLQITNLGTDVFGNDVVDDGDGDVDNVAVVSKLEKIIVNLPNQ